MSLCTGRCFWIQAYLKGNYLVFFRCIIPLFFLVSGSWFRRLSLVSVAVCDSLTFPVCVAQHDLFLASFYFWLGLYSLLFCQKVNSGFWCVCVCVCVLLLTVQQTCSCSAKKRKNIMKIRVVIFSIASLSSRSTLKKTPAKRCYIHGTIKQFSAHTRTHVHTHAHTHTRTHKHTSKRV